jgi:Flp pilus assembly protein TadG
MMSTQMPHRPGRPRRARGRLGDNTGGVLPLFVVALVALLGMMALAVDVGFALTARSEAQRVSDSSALAGASVFLDQTGLVTVPVAKQRAKEYAARNHVRGEFVDTMLVSTSSFVNTDGFEVFQDVTTDMTVQVIPGEYKVRVWVRRDGLETWFAKVLGRNLLGVEAMAAAVASEGGTADQCVLPFAIPDIWHDNDDDENGNRLPDGDEDWVYDPSIDDYRPWDGSDCLNCDNGTGYGSNWRNPNGTVNDVGTRMWIKSAPPGQSGQGSGGSAGGTDDPVGPGNFMIWSMPDPENDCEPRSGAQWVAENIATCNTCPIGVGADYSYDTEPGNKAMIKDPLLDLIAQDPGAYWDDDLQEVVSPNFDDPFLSPRVRIVPLWAPGQDLQGRSTMEFNNFARIFLEGEEPGRPPDFALYARFVGRIAGGPEGPETGPLVRYLRLVE